MAIHIASARQRLSVTMVSEARSLDYKSTLTNGAFLREGKRSIVDLKSVILFTDGFYIPKKDPVDDDNWDLFIKLYKEGGINKIEGYIRNIENSDSNCWEFPRGKKHDDMTAILIDFD